MIVFHGDRSLESGVYVIRVKVCCRGGRKGDCSDGWGIRKLNSYSRDGKRKRHMKVCEEHEEGVDGVPVETSGEVILVRVDVSGDESSKDGGSKMREGAHGVMGGEMVVY